MPRTHDITRRRYSRRNRRCQDCGREWMPTTEIVWWDSGFRYWVCRDCIKPYRPLILGRSDGG